VRFAPVFCEGLLYAGSDDGCVYCLSAKDGSLIWKRRIGPDQQMIPGNGRMISRWPVRTGLVVEDGTVYCTAGLFPEQGTYLVALDAGTGSVEYQQRIEVSPQGYLLASPQRLYVPTGRTNPVIFSRSQGTPEGQIESAGGAYALLMEDVLVTGPGRGSKQLLAGEVQTKDTIATFGGLRMVVSGSVAYMQSERQLAAFDRGRYLRLSRSQAQLKRTRTAAQKSLDKMEKDQPQAEEVRREIKDLDARIRDLDVRMNACYLWTAPCRQGHSMIAAGRTLFVGGENEVAAIDSENGNTIWTGEVEGKAAGLCIAQGDLYVSTDAGRVHCFRHAGPAEPRRVTDAVNPDPYPQDEFSHRYDAAVRGILRRASTSKGYCLILGCGDGRLACELARRSEFQIVAVEPDAAKADRTRRLLDRAGLSGRAVVHHVPDGRLPYTSYCANVVVSDGLLCGGPYPDPCEVFRVLRPCGGVVALAAPAAANSEPEMRKWGRTVFPGWRVAADSGLVWGLFARGELDGSGQWTHLHAEPGNSACSGDKAVKGTLTLQWFGEPGPRDMIDRHHRNVSPLARDGRLFVPGDCLVFAVDLYNGTPLWRIDLPDSRRLGAFLDGGSMVVDDRMLYVVAGDMCRSFDVESGRPGVSFAMPQLENPDPHKWGYVAREGSLLFGSGCKPEAFYTETSHKADDALWYRDMEVVTSDYLFAKDKDRDELLWTYRGGLVLNTTITLVAGRICFVETDCPQALADANGRMPVKTLFAGGDQHLVGLDQQTGRIVFKRKIDVSHFEEPVFLNSGQGVLLLSGSRLADKSVWYSYDAFDARTGEELWHAGHDSGLPTDGGHGEYNRHPAIVGETVYAWPYAYTLRTGERIEGWKFERRGHGCGGVSASAQCLFWRGGNPWMYDLGPGGGPARLNTVSRPGCWINMIPAGGLLLIPEASSGCTCGFPLQTSLAYLPVSSL